MTKESPANSHNILLFPDLKSRPVTDLCRVHMLTNFSTCFYSSNPLYTVYTHLVYIFVCQINFCLDDFMIDCKSRTVTILASLLAAVLEVDNCIYFDK